MATASHVGGYHGILLHWRFRIRIGSLITDVSSTTARRDVGASRVPYSRLAVWHVGYFGLWVMGGSCLTLSATLRQAPIRSTTSRSSTSIAPSYSVRFRIS